MEERADWWVPAGSYWCFFVKHKNVTDFMLWGQVIRGLLMEIAKVRGFESLPTGILNKSWFRKVAAKVKRRE